MTAYTRDTADIDHIAAVRNLQKKRGGIDRQHKPDRKPGPMAAHGLAHHKPAQAHHLHHEGNKIELVGRHVAEHRGHFPFQALQNQLD
jgi:hypothetical protein